MLRDKVVQHLPTALKGMTILMNGATKCFSNCHLDPHAVIGCHRNHILDLCFLDLNIQRFISSSAVAHDSHNPGWIVLNCVEWTREHRWTTNTHKHMLIYSARVPTGMSAARTGVQDQAHGALDWAIKITQCSEFANNKHIEKRKLKFVIESIMCSIIRFLCIVWKESMYYLISCGIAT